MKDRKYHKCGCAVKLEEGVWRLVEYCKTHTPNWSKKADKAIRKNESLTKRRKFLEERLRRKKR